MCFNTFELFRLCLMRQMAINKPITKKAMTHGATKKRGGLMRNKRFKSPRVMLTVLLLANYLVPQAQAGLILSKGVRGELSGLAAPALELGAIPPESFDPEVDVEAEWISFLHSTIDGEWQGINARGCKDKRATGGVVCGYLDPSSIVPAPQFFGAEGFAGPALFEADGDENAVPIPGTLVLFGLGLALLGSSRRRR